MKGRSCGHSTDRVFRSFFVLSGQQAGIAVILLERANADYPQTKATDVQGRHRDIENRDVGHAVEQPSAIAQHASVLIRRCRRGVGPKRAAR
jgi:hypothetical protein